MKGPPAREARGPFGEQAGGGHEVHPRPPGLTSRSSCPILALRSSSSLSALAGPSSSLNLSSSFWSARHRAQLLQRLGLRLDLVHLLRPCGRRCRTRRWPTASPWSAGSASAPRRAWPGRRGGSSSGSPPRSWPGAGAARPSAARRRRAGSRTPSGRRRRSPSYSCLRTRASLARSSLPAFTASMAFFSQSSAWRLVLQRLALELLLVGDGHGDLLLGLEELLVHVHDQLVEHLLGISPPC